MSPHSFISPQYSWRLAYDLSFFILIIVILLKLIFGIIIDTFQELRAENQMLDEDNQNRCFICGIQRDVFERQGHDFEQHIFHDHNLWHYLYFNMYLRRKDRTEYTGPEQYVADKVRPHVEPAPHRTNNVYRSHNKITISFLHKRHCA